MGKVEVRNKNDRDAVELEEALAFAAGWPVLSPRPP
jgi:hypothetical protein